MGLDESIARDLSRALLSAVEYLHGQGIVHRDLGPKNVLVSSSLQDLRVIDFNAACLHDAASACEPLTPTGTLLFCAPEVVLGEPSSAAADVWTAGLCVYLMVSGHLPQGRGRGDEHLSRMALLEAASRREDFNSRHLQQISEACKSLLRSCLSADQVARPSAAALLCSEWLAEPSTYHSEVTPRISTSQGSLSWPSLALAATDDWPIGSNDYIIGEVS